MIKVIIFDLNDVLVTYKEIDLNERYIRELGVDNDTFWNACKEFFPEYNLGDLSFDDVLKRALKKLKLNVALLDKAKKLHEDGLSLVNGMLDVLIKLKQKYKLVLFAGDGAESIDFKLDHFGLRKFFSRVYATCFERTTKSDLRLYLKILRECDLIPSETLFVDDMEKHVMIAQRLGINAILFKDAEQLKKDLVSFGVIIN